MNTSALEDIQKALNAIRGDIERADAETKLAALELIMATSQSVVAMARKLTSPKVKTRTVIVPKEKVIKVEPRLTPARRRLILRASEVTIGTYVLTVTTLADC